MPRENDRVEIYHAQDGWRWRRVAANGDKLSSSTESYENLSWCEEIAKQLNPGISIAETE